jgi:hypothetical protein
MVPIMMEAPVEGRDFPGSLPELRAWFRSDADRVDYLDWLRWPDGFVCPWCADVGDWSATASIYRCNGCRRRVSVTSQTVFHRTRTPLTVWFEAAWLMMVSKPGLSALNLQRVADLGSHQTAWTMTHKLQTVMSQSGRKRLTGRIEIDETYVGGAGKPGLTGRGAAGKTLVAGADAWRSYPAATAAAGVAHEVRNVSASGQPAHVSLPGVHRLFSLSKRVLEGTYQGSVQPEHLQAYLDEFVFRSNRRNSHTRGMLFLRLLESAVGGHPAPYADLAVIHRKPRLVPVPPQAPHALPRTLTGPPLERPWRSARAA